MLPTYCGGRGARWGGQAKARAELYLIVTHSPQPAGLDPHSLCKMCDPTYSININLSCSHFSFPVTINTALISGQRSESYIILTYSQKMKMIFKQTNKRENLIPTSTVLIFWRVNNVKRFPFLQQIHCYLEEIKDKKKNNSLFFIKINFVSLGAQE